MFKLEEINNLERKFLELVDYDVTVSPVLYAKYYFELRSVCADGTNLRLLPLSALQAKMMIVRSRALSEHHQRVTEKERKRRQTTDSSLVSGKGHVILS
jgi:hypothetical protein